MSSRVAICARSVYTVAMMKPLPFRAPEELIQRLDQWVASQRRATGLEVSRPAAIRAILEKILPPLEVQP